MADADVTSIFAWNKHWGVLLWDSCRVNGTLSSEGIFAEPAICSLTDGAIASIDYLYLPIIERKTSSNIVRGDVEDEFEQQSNMLDDAGLALCRSGINFIRLALPRRELDERIRGVAVHGVSGVRRRWLPAWRRGGVGIIPPNSAIVQCIASGSTVDILAQVRSASSQQSASHCYMCNIWLTY